MQQNNESSQQRAIVLWLKKYILHNWPWKAVSLLIAILLWGGLITQDDSLTREKSFTDVTIGITNTETLRRNGFIVVEGLDTLPLLKMRVEVPQKMYNSVKASNYNPRIDLSSIRSTGEHLVKVSYTNTTTYGSVTDISTETVPIVVEEYITRSRIPVRLNVTGTLAAHLYAATPSTDPLYVTVSGPKSQVESIARCVVYYDLSVLSATGVERTAVPFSLVDVKGNVINSNLIEVTSESVLLDTIMVEQNVYANKLLPINTLDITTGTPAGGYIIKSITAEPASITVAGLNQWIDSVDSFRLADFITEKINVNGSTATIHRSVRLNKNANIAAFGQDTVLITIEIAAE